MLVDEEAQESQSESNTEGSLKDFIVSDSDVEAENTKLVSSLHYSFCDSYIFSRKSKSTLRRQPLASDDSNETSDGLSEHERCVIFFNVRYITLSLFG